MKTKYLIAIGLLILISCGTPNKKPINNKVKYKGALKNIMHKGDLSAKVDLLDFENTDNYYALGAIENLKGEIQIFDSKPFISSVHNGHIFIDTTFNKKATLLVYATVKKWISIEISNEIKTYHQLELFIEQKAKENIIPLNEPFPFLISGKPIALDWHIINWKDGDTEHSHEKHINSGIHETLTDISVEILGFYSKSHHAIFTHHTTNMHLHFKAVENNKAGHVDDLVLGTNMTLLLPSTKKK